MIPPAGSRAFSLVELLVVVTIIVVLLALLMPALDQAVYQAELATCGANLKGIGSGITVYAAEHKRFYPPRQYGDSRPMSLSGLGVDTRPALTVYMSLKMLIDPLCKPVDLSIEANDPNLVFTYSSNWLWFGWKILPSHRGLFKIGDRMEWTDPAGRQYAFDLLATDGLSFFEKDSTAQQSHPDREGRSANDRGVQVPGVIGLLTYSLWFQADTRVGNETDDNYLFGDLSVKRLDRLKYNGAIQTMDGRLVKIPERYEGLEPERVHYLPQP